MYSTAKFVGKLRNGTNDWAWNAPSNDRHIKQTKRLGWQRAIHQPAPLRMEDREKKIVIVAGLSSFFYILRIALPDVLGKRVGMTTTATFSRGPFSNLLSLISIPNCDWNLTFTYYLLLLSFFLLLLCSLLFAHCRKYNKFSTPPTSPIKPRGPPFIYPYLCQT